MEEKLKALFKVRYVGETFKEDWGMAVDMWIVGLKDKEPAVIFEYFTGLGLRKEGKPVPPDVFDVMQCLVGDAEAHDYAFDSWCWEFGYDSDSIKALSIYKECLDTYAKLRKVFSHLEIKEIRQLCWEKENGQAAND